tara:strand:- start:141 stop:383 length:243 start_codon:yes stop_codon:yes gene_type:complete
MIVIEEFSWISGIRVTDKVEYNSEADWRRDLFINTLAGTHVGYKLYNCSMSEFDAMTDLERSQSVVKQKFDKEAYLGDPK